jgi:DHA3 family macrolide efflux protein-like MFS transporter
MNIEATEIITKPRSVFLNRNFLLLFFGKIISQLGDWVYIFALGWYILDLTKSSFQMSLFLVIETLVVAIVSPFGGIIADRFNRKRIMVWMDVIRGIIVLVAALLLYFHLLQIWMIYLSAMVLGFCGALFGPAAGAIIPNIVDENQLTQATSADQFVVSFCTIIGMIISGFLYGLVGITMIFILNAFSYFVSGVMENCVEIPWKKPEQIGVKSTVNQELKKTIKDLKEGFRYLLQNKLIANLVLMNFLFVLLCVPIVHVYTPYIFNVILKATPFQLSIPQSAIWMGMILGSIAVPLFLHRYKLKDAIFWGLLISSIGISLETLVLYPQLRSHFNNWEITAFLSAPKIIGGLSMTFFIIPINVIYQKFTSDEYRGRFWGLQGSLMTLAMSSGYFLAGFFAQRVWLGYLFYIPAIALLIMIYRFTNLKEIKELGG